MTTVKLTGKEQIDMSTAEGVIYLPQSVCLSPPLSITNNFTSLNPPLLEFFYLLTNQSISFPFPLSFFFFFLSISLCTLQNPHSAQPHTERLQQ